MTIRLVHVWPPRSEMAPRRPPVSSHRRLAADQGPAREVRRVLAACPTDRRRTGWRDVRLAQNAGELQCKHPRDRLEVCVVERNWHNRSNRLDARRVKDCPALEAGSETARVHDAVITALICPGGHGRVKERSGPHTPPRSTSASPNSCNRGPKALRSASRVGSRRTSSHRPRRRWNVAVPRARRKPAETSPVMSAGSPVSASSSSDGRNAARVSAKQAVRWRAAYTTRKWRAGSSKRLAPIRSAGGQSSGFGRRPNRWSVTRGVGAERSRGGLTESERREQPGPHPQACRGPPVPATGHRGRGSCHETRSGWSRHLPASEGARPRAKRSATWQQPEREGCPRRVPSGQRLWHLLRRL